MEISPQEHWATDTLVSFPEPPPQDAPVLTDFQGLGFSMNGIVHNISDADLEDLTTPHFAPEGFRGITHIGGDSDFGDAPLDGER